MLLFSFVLCNNLRAQSGKDGIGLISSTGVIFNRYDALAASAPAGGNTLTTSNITNLSSTAIAGAANNPFTTSTLSFGDLIMIIKLQGATITTTNTAAYGAVTAYNNTGSYELQAVQSVAGNVISLCGTLANAYVVGGTQRVEVVRIPRLSSLTVNAGASLTGSTWGTTYTGGIVAIEVSGNAIINGSVLATGIGFRGGVVDNLTTGPPGTSNFTATTSADGGEKGEGVAGFQTDYDGLTGRYDRGAPANGGGGGVAHNSSAGGGANGGIPANWNGLGNPDNSGLNYTIAWDLEGGSFHSNTSSGGGRGGYSYGANNVSPILTAPGNTAWGGDNRRNIGGYGGRPLTYGTNILFMGGGGGAGDANNSAAVNGASGGGIIYMLINGSIAGTGAITANGNTAGNTISGNNDAPGGGGGGGAIALNVSGSVTGVTVNANGGAGGNQGALTNESEGPGGGGGGGYVIVSGAPVITVNVNGGANGTTASTAQTLFPPNGATAGGVGTKTTGTTFVAAPIGTCSTLPVTLLSFDAILNNQGFGLLTWSSDLEYDMKDYEVQKSTDQINWQSIGKIDPLNLSRVHSYQFNAGLLGQLTYFRLKMEDIDGSFTHSPVRSLNPNQQLRLYATSNNLVLNGFTQPNGDLRVYNMVGSLLKTAVLSGQAYQTIDIGFLPRGTYVALWTNGAEHGQLHFAKY